MKKVTLLLLLFFPFYCAEGTFRYYLGGSAEFVMIAGSFDGESFFEIDNQVIMVPKIDPGFGFGINGGFRFGNFAIDFQYKRSGHNATLMDGSSTTCNMNVIKFLGFKSYMGNTHLIKPFIDFDLSGSWIKIAEASYWYDSPANLTWASFGAVILGLGIGTEIRPHKRIGIEIECLPAWYVGTDTKGIERINYEITKFGNFKLDGSLSLIYYFNEK